MLRLVESAQAYPTGPAVPVWARWSATDTTTVVAAAHRDGVNKAIRANIDGGGLTATLDSRATWIVGQAVRVSAFPSGPGDVFGAVYWPGLVGFRDGGTEQCRVTFDTTGHLRAQRGDGTQLGTSTSDTVLVLNTYAYLVVQVTIGNSGSIAAWLDGVQVLDLSGVDTQQTANATADRIQFGNPGNFSMSGSADRCDLYVLDTSGSTNNTPIDDMSVRALRPSGAGSQTHWTPNTGANYAAVAEVDPDDDTTYIAATPSLNTEDLYALADLPAVNATIYAVATVVRARKTDSGTATVQSALRSGGTTDHGAVKSPGTTYAYTQDIWETDPSDSAAWTRTKVDALEVGVFCP